VHVLIICGLASLSFVVGADNTGYIHNLYLKILDASHAVIAGVRSDRPGFLNVCDSRLNFSFGESVLALAGFDIHFDCTDRSVKIALVAFQLVYGGSMIFIADPQLVCDFAF
jgi:hypothetical protein